MDEEKYDDEYDKKDVEDDDWDIDDDKRDVDDDYCEDDKKDVEDDDWDVDDDDLSEVMWPLLLSERSDGGAVDSPSVTCHRDYFSDHPHFNHPFNDYYDCHNNTWRNIFFIPFWSRYY